MNSSQGFTLVEMMVSITISSLLSVAIVSSFSTQSVLFLSHSKRMQATEDGREVFEVITRLLQQAHQNSIVITQNTSSDIQIDFTLPSGYPIWPNTISPYDKNAVRIRWTGGAVTSANTKTINQITVANASDIGSLNSSTAMPLAGSADHLNTRISQLALATLGGGTYYKLDLSSEVGRDKFAIKNTFSGLVLPRN